MGLFDFLSAPDNGNGIGGLLSYLQSPLYQSPLLKPADVQQPQYDPMGNYSGITPWAPNPFGPIPQANLPTPDQFQAPSVFSGGTAAVAGLPLFGANPQPPPQAPIPQQAPPDVQSAPQIANTMNIGGYQMPQIGSAADYTPQPQAPVSTDISAQSQPLSLPPALQEPSILGRIGNPDGLIARLTGNDSRSIAQQNLRATFEATRQVLKQSGMSDQEANSKAMLAVLNPEAGKTILPEALTSKEDIKTVKDAFGNEHLVWVNPRTQQATPLEYGGSGGASGAPGADLQGLTENLSKMAQSGATREQMLQQVPADYRGYVSAVLAGKALPSNIGRSPARAGIMTMAHAVDPNFDESTIPLRFKTQADYAPNGKSGQSIVALNTVQHHIGKLSDDLENLGDTGFTPLNAAWNAVARNTPFSPAQGKATQSVQDDIKAVTDEMSAAYKAGKVSDHEIEAWGRLANSNLPVRQLKQGIADFVGLLNGKRDQLNETHQQIVGTEAPGINKELNEAITKKVTERNSGQTAAPSIQEGATATNPQTGQKITFRNGKWQ